MDLPKGKGIISTYGVKVDKNSINYCKTRGLEAIKATGALLPFGDSCLDIVVRLDLIEHLLHPQRLFEEVKRILKPEGLFALIVPNFKYLLLKHNIRISTKRGYLNLQNIRIIFQRNR